jgi:hypothetical protein
MRDYNELPTTVQRITNSEVAAAIRYLDPMPAKYNRDESDDTFIVVFISALIFLIAALPFISLYLKTS